MSRPFYQSTRGSSVLVGGVLLVGIAVVLAGAVGAVAFGAADAPQSPPRPVALSLSVSGTSLSVTHEGGPSLDVRSLRLVVTVDGESLRYQPPVPFFSARGFAPGPTGPFNAASDPRWTAGETASLELAGTNAPAIRPGSRVVVRIYEGDSPVAVLRSRAS